MSDTSTAQPTWHGLSNRLTSSSLSVKEFVELPLLSSYNNAFLETITEEGSEFEPSDDGSASFEQSDYLPFESIRVEQATGSLVRADPSLMIGELESPDYEEVFPLPIQSFPSFHKELLDYSNLLVPFSKANCSDFSIQMQNGSQIYAKDTVSLQMNEDPDTLKHQSELVNGNTKEENNNDELIKTSDYQSYDEADMPTDGVDDWGEGLVLDQTPGRTETIKHVASSKSSGEALHSSEGCGVLLQSSDNPLNPGNPWINDQDLKEEVMILSTEDDEKFVWKLEHRINSQTVNQAAVMPSPQRSEFRFYLPQKTKENSFHFCSDRNDAPGNIALKQSSNKTDEPNGKLNDSQLTTNYEDNSASSSEGTRTLVETVKAPRHFITQTSSIPAIPRPILPRICNSDIAKPHMMDPEPIPPPKPQFPRHGYPELLFGQVKGLRSSFGLTIAPVTSASTSARPPLPPRPGSKPVMQNVNCFFQPALSYRELLSTTHPTDQTTIQKCQSYHSDSTAVQLYERNTLMDAATIQSFVDYRGPTFGSNLERMTNPLTSSYPRFGGNSTSDRSAFLESQKNWSSNSYFGQLSQGFSGKSCMLQDQGDVLIENPAYMSTFFSESSKQREETSVHAPSKFIFGKSQPVTSKIQFTDANSVPSTSNVERNTPNECPLTERSSGDYHSINPVTTQVLPPSSIQTESQSKNYPIWIANSTPLAHYYASHSAMSGMVNKNGTTVSKVPELTINSALDNLSPPTEELVVQDNPNRLSTRTSSTNLPGQSLKSNPRPIQRSFAVVGVSELLAKTDEELNQFLQGAERKLVSSGPDLADELSNESSGNQISSTSGGPMEHSPVRRRFQSNRIGPNVNRQSFDSVETESDSDHLDRRSFYDYGCDDDDDDIEESNGNDIDEVVSEVELRGVRRTVRAGDRDGFSGSKPFTSAETDGILCQLKLLNEDTQLVWSDSCPVAASSQEHKSIKELDYTASQSDMPFIDSDSFQNEPWNNGIGGADVWRLNYSYKPIRANLDEVTLSSDRTSSKLSWGSTNAINYLSLIKTPLARGDSRKLIENEYDEVEPDDEQDNPRTRSRRASHSCDSSKPESRLQKLTAPWLQRLCGCVRPSRFRRKKSI